jgi:hypothetical protein
MTEFHLLQFVPVGYHSGSHCLHVQPQYCHRLKFRLQFQIPHRLGYHMGSLLRMRQVALCCHEDFHSDWLGKPNSTFNKTTKTF